MNHPALKGEVSKDKQKMLGQITPRLRRSNVVLNSFASCISNTPKEFPWAPEMSFSKIIPQPRMLMQKLEGTVSFEQLQGLANADSSWHFNKQVDVVNSNVQLINFESMFVSNLSDKEFTIHSDPIKLHGVSSIFAFPHKVESILPEGMFKTFQFHFLSPEYSSHYIQFISGGLGSNPSSFNNHKELNPGGGNSSLCLKAEVSLPRM